MSTRSYWHHDTQMQDALVPTSLTTAATCHSEQSLETVSLWFHYVTSLALAKLMTNLAPHLGLRESQLMVL